MAESFSKSSHREDQGDWSDFVTAFPEYNYNDFAPTYLSEEEWRESNKTDEMQFEGKY